MSDTERLPYATHLDIKFQALSLVDVPALVEACTDRWYNQTLCKVNDSVVRLGVMQGEYRFLDLRRADTQGEKIRSEHGVANAAGVIEQLLSNRAA